MEQAHGGLDTVWKQTFDQSAEEANSNVVLYRIEAPRRSRVIYSSVDGTVYASHLGTGHSAVPTVLDFKSLCFLLVKDSWFITEILRT